MGKAPSGLWDVEAGVGLLEIQSVGMTGKRKRTKVMTTEREGTDSKQIIFIFLAEEGKT